MISNQSVEIKDVLMAAVPGGGGGEGGTRSGKGYRLWTKCCGAVAVASKQC